MASTRPYRAALGIDAAMDEIRDGAGTRFDPDVVDACVRLVENGAVKFDERGSLLPACS